MRSYSWEFNLLCLDTMESVIGQGHGALVDQSQALRLEEEVHSSDSELECRMDSIARDGRKCQKQPQQHPLGL